MKIIECPRDAMQGIDDFIPTNLKVDYINLLLKVGFDTIDFGSFVSPKAVPQMKDTEQVLRMLQLKDTKSKLLAIVANQRGAEQAAAFPEVTYLGFPLSISETFQVRNTNKTIVEALNALEKIKDIADQHGKVLVTYISMGFGNPYGDPYNTDIVLQFAGILDALGINVISLADTIGISTNKNIEFLFKAFTSEYPSIELGAHLHSTPESAFDKIQSAYDAGCRRFDGAINGYGGCPMAEDKLVGNIATETILKMTSANDEQIDLDSDIFNACLAKAAQIFP